MYKLALIVVVALCYQVHGSAIAPLDYQPSDDCASCSLLEDIVANVNYAVNLVVAGLNNAIAKLRAMYDKVNLRIQIVIERLDMCHWFDWLKDRMCVLIQILGVCEDDVRHCYDDAYAAIHALENAVHHNASMCQVSCYPVNNVSANIDAIMINIQQLDIQVNLHLINCLAMHLGADEECQDCGNDAIAWTCAQITVILCQINDNVNYILQINAGVDTNINACMSQIEAAFFAQLDVIFNNFRDCVLNEC